ncbi:MAG: HAMP domain-containing histidine kinase [Bacteroidota bacterium]|nr:HAMP domain-containing histidine kinase [Bacteroidota bacterium]
MSSYKIRLLVILGALAIIGILVMQAFFLVKNYNKEEAEFHQAVSIALRNTATKIALYNKVKLPERGLIRKEASNFYEVNVKSPIEQTILSTYLETEFEKQNLHLTFEYGIYDCATNELIFGDCCNYSDKKVPLKTKKTKAKKSDAAYYFVVRFPDRDSFVNQQLSSTIIFSALLVLACIIFIITIFGILRQKRYAEMMKEFVNNMTHEFKTPISSIKISADVLMDHPLIEGDHRLMQYATIIKDQNLRLNNQVEKVLQIAKMESSSFSLKKEEIDIHEMLMELTRQYGIRLKDFGGQIEVHLDALKHKVKADKFHMMNVFSNLLDNAMKYSKAKPELHVITYNSGKDCAVEFIDKGIGIKKENLQKLFQKFYRVSTGDVHNVKGFGIGLYYVKRICDAHGYEVTIQSEFEKGTRVRILLKNI